MNSFSCSFYLSLHLNLSSILKRNKMVAYRVLLVVIYIVFLLGFVDQSFANRPTEDERVRLWHANGNTWPPTWHPESEAYKKAMDIREKEIMAIPGADERWENWMQFTQGRMLPKFTENGFEVVKAPKKVLDKLLAVINKGLEKFEEIPEEFDVEAIYGDIRPKFLNIGGLAWEVLEDLKEMHEQWAGGMKLIPTSSYGVRLYQNGSSLVMHKDKCATHVISSIFHLVHQYDKDDQPWNIEIEDHDGNLHAHALESGDLLFYESAKCLHGRMSKFKGKYYGSIFLHYKPVDTNIWNYRNDEVIEKVPPHWRDGIKDPHGSRWAGQAITTDSRVCEGAPPRIFGNKIPATRRRQTSIKASDMAKKAEASMNAKLSVKDQPIFPAKGGRKHEEL
jgi:hypothetical protein